MPENLDFLNLFFFYKIAIDKWHNISGESPKDALSREIKEELAVKIKVEKHIHTIEFDYPNFHLSMDCFACELEENQEITLLEHKNAKWLDKSNLYSVDWLPADVDVLDKIEEML